MNRWAGIARNERGVALPLALFVLVSLSAFVLAFLSMGGMEPQVARNLSDTARARYVTDAAIEWAFDQFANPATTWSTVLAGPQVAGTGTSATNPRAAWVTPVAGGNPVQQTLPGLTASSGTYTVQVRNDVLATDTAITGVAADTGGATTDLNSVLIVTATGTYGGVSRQIQVVVRRITFPPMPGALNCGGLQCDLDMGVVSDWTNHHFHAVGLDYAQDPSNPANMIGVSGNMKYAIAAPTGNQSGTGQTFESRVENALNLHQLNELDGLVQGSNPPTANVSRLGHVQASADSGKSTIAGDSTLVSKVDGSGNFLSNSTSDFVNKLKAQPGVTVLKSQTGAAGVTIQNGNPLGANSSLPINLGCVTPTPTCSGPTISYFKGDPNPSNLGRVLQLTGTNSGAGILIVEDGILQIFDSFRWDGVIILTGQNVAVTFDKSVIADVYGGVMLNETKNGLDTPNYELQLQKNCIHSEDTSGCGGNDSYYTKLYSSQQRRDQAQSIRSLVTMSSWREI